MWILNMEYNLSNFLFNIFSVFNANKSFIVNDMISLWEQLVHRGQGPVAWKEDNAIHQINLYPCIIHHNQLLSTKFGRIRHLNNQDLAIITFARDTGCNTRAKIWYPTWHITVQSFRCLWVNKNALVNKWLQINTSKHVFFTILSVIKHTKQGCTISICFHHVCKKSYHG